MVFFKRIRPFICPVILLALLFISVLVLANVLIQRPSVQKYLLNRAGNAIGYEILTGDIELNFWGGIGILINDFEATSREGIKTFTASEVIIDLVISELIRGRLVADSICLFKPEIQLTLKTGPDIAGKSNIFGVEGFREIPIPNVQSIIIEQGKVGFIGSTCSLNDLYINAGRTTPVPMTFTVKAYGRMEFEGKEAPFDLRGIILPGFEKGKSPSVDIFLKTEKTPLTWIPWPHSLPVKEGDLEAGLKIEGNPETGISISGKIDMESLKFSIQWRDRNKDFSIPDISFDFQSIIKERSIRFDSLKMNNHDFSMDLNLLVDLKEKVSPYLELSAKSEFMSLKTLKMLFPSPILPLWLENDLFPILISGDVKLKTFNLTGNTKTIKRLKLPENRSALGMDFECQNFEVSGNGIQLPFNNVSAEVSYKKGDFFISGLKGYFGESVIDNAGLNVIRKSGEPPVFRISMEGSFNLRELIDQRGMEVIPSKAQLWLDQFKGLDGWMECNTEIGYEKGAGFPKVLTGEFSFDDCSFDIKELIFPIRLDKARVLIHENNENNLRGTGRWGKTTFNITGDFGITGKSVEFKKIDISSDIDMNQLFSSVFKGSKIPFKFISSVPWNASMKKEKDYYSYLGSIGIEGLTLESENISIKPLGLSNSIQFDMELRPNSRIDFKKIFLKLKNSSIIFSGVYDLQKKYLYQFQADSSLLTLEDLNISVKKTGVPLRGNVKGSIRALLPERSIRSANIQGVVEGEAISFHFGKLPSPVSDCSFLLDFNGKKVIINSLDMKAGESDIQISGDLNGWDKLEGNVLINSAFLNPADVLSTENLFDHKERSRWDHYFKDLEVGIELDIARGVWRKLKYDRINADLALRREGIFIKESGINLENGSLKINGHIIGGDKPDLLLSGDIRLTNQPVYELMESLGLGYGRFIGNVNMDAQLSMNGKEKEDLLPSLSGSGKILLGEGLIKNSRVFIKVLNFLSLQNLYKERPEELREEGFYFESMAADFTIDQGILSSENFEMKSPAFNALANGKINIPNKTTEFILGAQPHETVDSLISNIPILGYIITGEKKAVMVYPFQVKGDIKSPSVKFIPLENLGEGVAGILKRLFLTPIRLLNGLGKAGENHKEEDISKDNQ